MAWSSAPLFTATATGPAAANFSFDSTGCDTLFLTVEYYVGVTGAPFSTAGITDGNGNTWNQRTNYSNMTGGDTRIFWCRPTSVGPGHTVDLAGTNGFFGGIITGWSGGAAAPYDTEAGGTDATPGPITASEDGCLYISAAAFPGGSTYTASGMTVAASVPYGAANNYGAGQAYLVQGTAASVGPTWGGGTADTSAIAAFKAAAGGGGVTVAATGVSSTTAVGLSGVTSTTALTGAASTGAVGTVTATVGVVAALTGVSSTSAVGSAGVSSTVPVTGASSTTAVGTVTATSGVSAALTGVASTTAPGSLTTSRTVTVTGTGATGAVGTVTGGGPFNPALAVAINQVATVGGHST